MSVLAVMATRNEAGYVERTIRTLLEEGIEVALVDNGSTDGTREIAEPFLGGGLVGIWDAPWMGRFDLAAILRIKQAIYERYGHDWKMHVDADEWPRAVDDVPLSNFLQGISADFLVVNFQEFVFLPPRGIDMWGDDYRTLATAYYLFEPAPRRLMRAWRRGVRGADPLDGGHRVSAVAADAVYPRDQHLRHYVGLSWSHAILKRASRQYPAEALARGWHANRVDMRAARPVDHNRYIKRAVPWSTRQLDTTAPSRYHFWQQEFHLGSATSDETT